MRIRWWVTRAKAERMVEEAELRLGRAWHNSALDTIRNALTDPDEPEVFSPFDKEARRLIRGMVAEARD